MSMPISCSSLRTIRLAVDEQPPLVRLVNPGENLDEAGLAGAVVAEDARDLAPVHVRRDVLQRDDVAVVLGDPVRFEQMGHRHLALCARLRISVLSSTAAKRIPPWKVKVQLLSHCESMIPSWTMPSIAAPKNVPITEPKPPVSRQPPTRSEEHT